MNEAVQLELFPTFEGPAWQTFEYFDSAAPPRGRVLLLRFGWLWYRCEDAACACQLSVYYRDHRSHLMSFHRL